MWYVRVGGTSKKDKFPSQLGAELPNIKCTKSESSYMRGCRCEDCREAHTVKERERRKARANKSKVESKGNGATTIRSNYEDSWTLQEILRSRGGSW